MREFTLDHLALAWLVGEPPNRSGRQTMTPAEREPSPCEDCGIDTQPPLAPHEYYMVHDEVWSQAGMPPEGFLCIGCLELRLGRRLSPSDFTSAPCNWWGWKTERLEARVTGRPTAEDARQARHAKRRHQLQAAGQLELFVSPSPTTAEEAVG